MNTEHLTIGEWTRWTATDAQFKERVINKLDTLQGDVLENAIEIKFMKQKHARGKFYAGLRTIITGIVGGIIGSFK